MEVQSPATAKRHYDITMSRRTRKQQQQSLKSDTNTTKDVPIIETSNLPNDHKSLKQLILGEEKDPMKNKNNSNNNHEGERGNKGRNINTSSSLGEHFNEEEKQLQLVKIQQKDNIQGLKFKKLVSRYAKVLGHLMKAKRDPHLGETAGKKKPLFKLSK